MNQSFKSEDKARPFFVAGGSLPPDTPSYIKRSADDELFDRAAAGDFCFVLTPRQMGKSSLMARTARRLRGAGVQSVVIDLTQIGTESEAASADRWYYGIAHQILRGLKIRIGLGDWWRQREQLPPLQRLTEFFSDIVLDQKSERVVIFVDEIDTTIKLAFTDDFFAAIRYYFNARATSPDFERLTFVLLGVASPSDLIADPKRTPFNIGHRIDLTDFTLEEALPLSNGFRSDPNENRSILERVLHWTNGHPYLTQRLCRIIEDHPKDNLKTTDIDDLVEQHFLSPQARREEANLRFVRDRLLGDRRHLKACLKEYAKVREGKTIADSPLDPVYSLLKLSGLISVDPDGYLRIRNRVYEAVFDERWVRKNLPKDKTIITAMAASVAVLVIGIGAWYTLLLPREYIRVLRTVVEDVNLAEDTAAKLKRIPGFSQEANRLLADFWERRAVHAAFSEDRDKALLMRMKAVENEDTPDRRKAANEMISFDYPRLNTTIRPGGSIMAVAFSPSGDALATASNDNTARLWDAKTGAPIGQIMRHEGSVWAVAFSPSGDVLATASNDKTARLWDAKTGAPIGQFMWHEHSVGAVAFSPSGDVLATASGDNTARLWDAKTGAPIGQPMKHEDWVTAVAFSPSGDVLATASEDNTARLWDVRTGAPIGQPMRHEGKGIAIAFGPTGNMLATATGEGFLGIIGTARLWDGKTGAPIGQPMRLIGAIRAVAFNPEGDLLATAGEDYTARLWDVKTCTSIGQPMRHEDKVIAVAFGPSGNVLATASIDGTARLWDGQSGVPIGQPMRHEKFVNEVVFSRSGNKLATAGLDDTVRLWKVQPWAPIGQPKRHEDTVRAVAFSPSGDVLATASNDNTARLWDAKIGAPIGQPMRHELAVNALAFSPSGDVLATASGDKARLWDAKTGAPIGQPMKHEDWVTAVAFSPSGDVLATASGDNTARLWDAKTGAPIGQPMKHEDWVTAVAFSPSGDVLATASEDYTARLWDVRTGTPIGQPMRHEEMIEAVAFSPEGDLFVTASRDGTARLWDGKTGAPIGQPMKHEFFVDAVAFGPSGDLLATVSDYSTVRLWDAKTGASIGEPMRHGNLVDTTVAFSPSGDRFITITHDWVHLVEISREPISWKPLESRLLKRPFSGAFRFSDTGGSDVEVVVGANEGPIKATPISFSTYDASPLEGDPAELLQDWLDRLALKFDSDGQIVLKYPPPSQKRIRSPEDATMIFR